MEIPEKYYLLNTETGYVISFDDINKAKEFKKFFNEWEFVKLNNFNDEFTFSSIKEPKRYYGIGYSGGIFGDYTSLDDDETLNDMSNIGNLFESKEEAEKAVEKLKAWKRLKDKGFKFDGYDNKKIDYVVDNDYLDRRVDMEFLQDFALLFGGEE